jgi:hypothetical protein
MIISKTWTAGILNGENTRAFSINEDGGTTGFGTPRFIVDQGGNVGIGVTDPQQTLSLKGGMNIDQTNQNSGGMDNNVFRFGNNSGEAIGSTRNGDDNLYGLDFYTLSVKRMSITNAGFVGIGTSNPTSQLCVNGNVQYTGYLGACSDIRYKTNLSPVSGALNNLLQLNPIFYHWNKEAFPEKQFDDRRQLGLSAQEVEAFYPEVVQTDANGYKSVDYGRLTVVLIKAIQEQQALIEELQAKVQSQKTAHPNR